MCIDLGWGNFFTYYRKTNLFTPFVFYLRARVVFDCMAKIQAQDYTGCALLLATGTQLTTMSPATFVIYFNIYANLRSLRALEFFNVYLNFCRNKEHTLYIILFMSIGPSFSQEFYFFTPTWGNLPLFTDHWHR